MALIKCPECGREISDQCKACPHCGFPMDEIKSNEKSIETIKSPEKTQTDSNNTVPKTNKEENITEPLSKPKKPLSKKTLSIAIIAAIACVILFIVFAGGGGKSVKGNQYRYMESEYTAYYIKFENDEVIVHYNKYDDWSGSASGKLCTSTDEKKYDVEYKKNAVVVNGKTYNYELSSNGNLKFDSKFLGISSRWD